MRRGRNDFFVLTGGPGSGKTSIVEALQRAGYARSVEAGRAVIQEEMASGGRALPWLDPGAFAQRMLDWDIQSYREAERQKSRVFFDRGVVDVAGYLRLSGLSIPKDVQKAVETFRYNRRVFIAPPWPEIYAQDRERKQEFEEAVKTYEVLREVYAEYGYKLIELPRLAVEQREQFILGTIVGLELYPRLRFVPCKFRYNS